MTARFTYYLETNDLLSKQQHGFRCNHSTESDVLQIVNNIYKILEEKYHVAGVFVDLSKAFDALDHRILLNKMEHIRIRGTPINLFKN